MYTKNVIGIGAAALALMGALGCCDVTNDGTKCEPAPAVKTTGPALLSDTGTCFAAPPPVDRSKIGSCGEVRGDLVYNLGNGAISNSSAARLMGGFEKPRSVRVSGGVPAMCNPVPEKYYETLRRNAAGRPAPAAAPVASPAAPAPVAARPADSSPWEPGVAAGGYCAPVVCPIPADSALVCKPGVGEGISDCFTLSDEELRAGPAVIVPGVTEVAPAEQPRAAVDNAAPAAPAVPTETSVAAGPADKYANVDKAEALAPPPELLEGTETAAATAPKAPTAFPVDTAVNNAERMPPVPHVTDMDEAVNAILTREQGYKTSSLPEVELPPSLN